MLLGVFQLISILGWTVGNDLRPDITDITLEGLYEGVECKNGTLKYCGDEDTQGPHCKDCLLVLWARTGCKKNSVKSPAHDKSSVEFWQKETVSDVIKNMNLFKDPLMARWCHGPSGSVTAATHRSTFQSTSGKSAHEVLTRYPADMTTALRTGYTPDTTTGLYTGFLAAKTSGLTTGETADRTTRSSVGDIPDRTTGLTTRDTTDRTTGPSTGSPADRTSGLTRGDAADRTTGLSLKDIADRTTGLSLRDIADRTTGSTTGYSADKDPAHRTTGLHAMYPGDRTVLLVCSLVFLVLVILALGISLSRLWVRRRASGVYNLKRCAPLKSKSNGRDPPTKIQARWADTQNEAEKN